MQSGSAKGVGINLSDNGHLSDILDMYYLTLSFPLLND